MDDRKRREHRPRVERVEARALPSSITDVMASVAASHQGSVIAKQAATLQYFEQQHSFPVRSAKGGAGGGGAGAGTGNNGDIGASSTGFAPFSPSTTSIADSTTNQGPQGNNFVAMPVGTLTPAELKRELFGAYFQGTYTVSPGRTDLEKAVTFITAAGHGTTFLHGDIQLRVVTPISPTYIVPVTTTSPAITIPATATAPAIQVPSATTTVPTVMETQLGGIAAIFDRNLNSNSVLGLDVEGANTNVDAAGHPIHFDKVTIDVNESSGLYDESFSQGTVDVRYTPSRTHARGLIEQGHVVVVIHAQIYTPNTDYILTNANINPGGPSA